MKYLILMAVLLTGCGENDPAAKNMELTKKQRAKIEERITPFGWVNIEGVSDLVAEVALAAKRCMPLVVRVTVLMVVVELPKLKGQTAEYIVGRLNQYRNGEKVGSQSNMMWGQAAGLSDTDINDLAEYIVTL